MDSDISTDPSDYTDYSDLDDALTSSINNNETDKQTKLSNKKDDKPRYLPSAPSYSDDDFIPNPMNHTLSINNNHINTNPTEMISSYNDSTDENTDDDSSYCYSSEPSYSDDDYLPNHIQFESLYSKPTTSRKHSNKNKTKNSNNYIPKQRRNKKKEKPLIDRVECDECGECGEIFSVHTLFKKHMNDQHNIDKPYLCPKCPNDGNRKRYKFKGSLKDHIARDHEMRRDYKCDICDRVFFTKYSFKYHQRVHDKRELIPCPYCNAALWEHAKWRKHMHEIHKIAQPYICNICVKDKVNNKQKTYANKAGLNLHIKRDHEGMERAWKCSLCSKAFYDKQNLERHQRVHDGKKPFKCNECGLRFSQNCSRKQHMIAVHLKQKNWPCTHCEKRFASSTGMKTHIAAVHNDAKYARFECRTCHRRWYEKGAYYKHLDTAHRPIDPKVEKIKKGQCIYPECNKKYDGRNCAESLKYHLVHTHKDSNYANYKCKKCEKLFYDKTKYRQHMKSKHNKNI